MSAPTDNHDFEQNEITPQTKFGKITELIERYTLFVLLLVILVLILIQVYFRFFTESSIAWSEELSRFLLIWLVFLGAVVALRQGAHIQIDSLLDIMPKTVRKIMLLLRNMIMILFLGMLFIGILPTLEVVSLQKSPGLGLNMKYVYGIFPISIGLMAIIVIWSFVTLFKGGEKAK